MKVLQLLQKLNVSEFENFMIYLKCPLHNKNNDLIELIENLPIQTNSSSKIKDWKSDFIEKQKWDENKLRKNSHLLLKCLQEFIMIQQVLANDKLKPYLLYRSNFNSFGAEESEKLYNKAILKYRENQAKSSEDLIYQFLLEKLHATQYSGNQKFRETLKNVKDTRNEFNEYEDILDYLENINLDFMKVQVIENDNDQQKKENIIIKIHKTVSQMYEGEDIEQCLNIISNAIKSNTSIPKEIVKDIIIKCTNYLIIQLNQGATNQSENIWSMFKLGLELEAIIPDLIAFRNIAYLACRANEFDWALAFIEEYKSALPQDQQESAYSFTKARIYGNMKDWQKLLETLRNVEYEDIAYNLNSKLFIIMAYLELDEYEALDSFIKSFKVFLRRRRNIPVARKNAFYGFTTVVDHIMKAAERRDKKRIAKAYEEIENNKAIPNQDWLKEKISEIEQVL